MAGLGARLFPSFSKLTSAQVNGYLMDQTIMRFATTAARDAAFGGAGEPTLAEGMTCYLDDTNVLQSYNGTTWVTLLDSDSPPALQLIKTQTVGSNVPNAVVTNAFSSEFDNYKVTWTGGATLGAAALTFQLGPSSVPNYNSLYYANIPAATMTSTINYLITNNGGTFSNCGMGDTNAATINIELFDPNKPIFTRVLVSWMDTRTDFAWGQGAGVHRVASAFTDFTISAGANLNGGTIRVYGYRN